MAQMLLFADEFVFRPYKISVCLVIFSVTQAAAFLI